MAAYQKRTGRDPRHAFAVGDAADIVARIDEYAASGIAKFVLRPIGKDDAELLEQTHMLIREVIPEIEARNRR